jgi:hypothetical protein
MRALAFFSVFVLILAGLGCIGPGNLEPEEGSLGGNSQNGLFPEEEGSPGESQPPVPEYGDGSCCIYFVHNNLGSPCLAEKEFLEGLKQVKDLEAREVITTSQEGMEQAVEIASAYGVEVYSVPWTFVCEEAFHGFGESNRAEIEKAIEGCECGCFETGGV